MRIGMVVVAAMVGTAFTLSGCVRGGADPAGGTTRPRAASPGVASNAPVPIRPGAGGGRSTACIVGTWRAVSVDGGLPAGDVASSLSGGGGFTMVVAPDGMTVVDFTAMAPVRFASQVAGLEIRGSYRYGGVVYAAMALPAGDVASGTWRPIGAVDFRSLTLTADLYSPVQTRVADKVSISQFLADRPSGSIDPQPVLRPSSFRCSAGTLELVAPGPAPTATIVSAGPLGGTWTLRRA